MVVGENGVLYVNTWSSRYYPPEAPQTGGFLIALQDKSGAGKATSTERFGETAQTGGAGGTGIGIYKNYLYAEINDRIVRYSLPAGTVIPTGAAETVVGSRRTWMIPPTMASSPSGFIPSWFARSLKTR